MAIDTDIQGIAMTDYEKFKELLSSFGVEFEEIRDNEKLIIKCNTESTKVIGYRGFFTSFEFTNSGKFLHIGIWE